MLNNKLSVAYSLKLGKDVVCLAKLYSENTAIILHTLSA